MNSPIKLIVGLGNPGPEYEPTRHNVGAWFVENLAKQFHQNFRLEKKLKGKIAHIEINNSECWLLIPTTYMNLSGQAVRAFAQFYKISPTEILIAHDELDFPAGVIRLKHSGGSGGHNGLKDIIAQLASPDFYRLRIGIGHPRDRDQVLDYVLHKPSTQDNELIRQAIEKASALIPEIISGEFEKAMQQLHTGDK